MSHKLILSFSSSPRLKQQFSVVLTRPGGIFSTLDALKVADTALFVLSANHPDGIDALGKKILIGCLAQGLSSTIVAVANLENLMLTVRILESSCLIHPANHCSEEDRSITGFVEIPIVVALFLHRQYK
jgi:hypothetical protein